MEARLLLDPVKETIGDVVYPKAAIYYERPQPCRFAQPPGGTNATQQLLLPWLYAFAPEKAAEELRGVQRRISAFPCRVAPA